MYRGWHEAAAGVVESSGHVDGQSLSTRPDFFKWLRLRNRKGKAIMGNCKVCNLAGVA